MVVDEVVVDEVAAGVGLINHLGQPRTKDPSRNTKGRKLLSVMMMSNVVISLYHITCKPRTKHNDIKLLCILERVVILITNIVLPN